MRDMFIIKGLKKKPYSTLIELQACVQKEMENLQMIDDDLQIGISSRTFSRVIGEIRKTFGVEVEYCRANRGYHIVDTAHDNTGFYRMMEEFELFTTLKEIKAIDPHVVLEKRRPSGAEHLHGMVHAIKNRLQVRFSYEKFWENEIVGRTVEPCLLKEFRNRWYLLAKDIHDGRLKCFGLDRIAELTITGQKHTLPTEPDLDKKYQDCFGIISPNGELSEEVVLSFTAFQGKYIKSLPLHSSQEILIDNSVELRIKLNVYITHDLVMELLSYGQELTVLQPETLRSEMQEVLRNALTNYTSNKKTPINE